MVGPGEGKGMGWAEGRGAWGTSRSGGARGPGLTVVGVNAKLDLPLNGGLDLLLPHALDAQVVEAACREGRCSGKGRRSPTPWRVPADAALGLTVPGPEASLAQDSQPWRVLGFEPFGGVKDP